VLVEFEQLPELLSFPLTIKSVDCREYVAEKEEGGDLAKY
jgi:hypothetical protein